MTRRIWISAGEPSGDRLGAQLVPALGRALPGTRIDAMGGPLLAGAGARLVEPMDALSARGLVEVVRHLPAHVAAFRRVRRALEAGRYALVILIDYPGYHLRVARTARRAGVPVLYYVAPQLWAWGEGRAAHLRAVVNRLAVVLPFEEPFFRRHDIPATWVGHPALDVPRPDPTEARTTLGLPHDRAVLALLPGGRAADARRHWPLFRDAARRVGERLPGVHVVVAGMPGGSYPGTEAWTIVHDRAALALAAADAALCKAGTATLDAALADTPMVVAYRHHPLTHAVARRVVRVRHVALVNLLAREAVAPEFLQDAARPAALADALVPLLDPDGTAATHQRRALARIRDQLGCPGAAGRVAALARELVA